MRTDGAGGVPLPASSLWRTPTPYILLLIGAMMVLNALVLLVMLICARNRSRRSSRRLGSDDDEPSARVMLAPLDREPKVAVIMAGERTPSFLASAKPLAFVAPRGADDEADGSSAATVPYV